MSEQLRAFDNDPGFKAQLLKMAEQHRLADEYIKGTYHDEDAATFRGCSVGCTVRDVNLLRGIAVDYSDHEALAENLGIPEFIPRLADTIFENLPKPLNAAWTERWLNAIPVGVNLDMAPPRFLLKLLDSLPEIDRKDVVDSIRGVREVLQNWSDTGAPDEAAAEAAARAAEAAAWAAGAAGAARAAAGAAEAAEAAAWAAWAAGAAGAARAAAEAAEAAAWAARAAAWEQIANMLIESIESCAPKTE